MCMCVCVCVCAYIAVHYNAHDIFMNILRVSQIIVRYSRIDFIPDTGMWNGRARTIMIILHYL